MHARAPDAQPVTCIISENPPTSVASSLEAGGQASLGLPGAVRPLWSVVDEPSLGQRTKKVGMWGGRVCPGPPGTGCFDLHLGRVGGECSDGTSGTRSVSESLASSLD